MRVLDSNINVKKTKECARTDGLVYRPVHLALRLRLFRIQDVLRHFPLEHHASAQKEAHSTVVTAARQLPFRCAKYVRCNFKKQDGNNSPNLVE